MKPLLLCVVVPSLDGCFKLNDFVRVFCKRRNVLTKADDLVGGFADSLTHGVLTTLNVIWQIGWPESRTFLQLHA